MDSESYEPSSNTNNPTSLVVSRRVTPRFRSDVRRWRPVTVDRDGSPRSSERKRDSTSSIAWASVVECRRRAVRYGRVPNGPSSNRTMVGVFHPRSVRVGRSSCGRICTGTATPPLHRDWSRVSLRSRDTKEICCVLVEESIVSSKKVEHRYNLKTKVLY